MGGNHKEMYAFETRRLTVDEREEFLAHVKIDYPGATMMTFRFGFAKGRLARWSDMVRLSSRPRGISMVSGLLRFHTEDR